MPLVPHQRPMSHLIRECMADERRALDSDAFQRQIVESLTPPATASAAPRVVVKPIEPAANPDPLRPTTLRDMIGQEKLRPLLRRLIDRARTGHQLDHLLFVGASGTGKTTLALIVARELGTRVFSLKAPVDMATLSAVRETARDGDVVFVDEIHMQVSGDRRGVTQACDPESFYMLLEDGILATPTGPLPFPRVTWIGATTDVGLLPEPLSNRFPLRPQLQPYTTSDMVEIGARSMKGLGLNFTHDVALLFAGASRANPRQVNAYVRAANGLALNGVVTLGLATEVIVDLNSTTLDGLTSSMQIVLKFLYQHGRRVTRLGVQYTASVNTLATAAGHSRDTKAINLLVEPYLLQRGLIEVRPAGRTLTPAGIERARELIGG